MPNVAFFTSLVPDISSQIVKPAPTDFDVQIYSHQVSDEEKISLVQDIDFLILFPSRISDEVLRAAHRLKLIQLVSAGYDTMNMSLCAELGIPVANNGGTNSIDVAEHTIAMILASYRRFTELDPNVRKNRWRATDTGISTYTIHNKTVGIVGMGNIGQQVAKRLKAFDAQLLYYDPYPLKPEVEEAIGVMRVSLEELLRSSDIVTLHVPLTEQTRGLIAQTELGLMKADALLVNTCRGPVVNEENLVDALKAKQIRGAALDVLEKEPPDPKNPLLKLKNVLLSPHSAGITYDTWERRGRFIFENLQQVWHGKPPMAVVK